MKFTEEERKRIEEELGIDLVTLFKALNGFYCVEYEYDYKRGYIPEREAGSMSNCPKRRYKPVRDCAITYDSLDHRYKLIPYDPVLREIKITSDFNSFNIEDYGKRWALKKEELTEGLQEETQ